jgi:putative ABC transport system permease protein
MNALIRFRLSPRLCASALKGFEFLMTLKDALTLSFRTVVSYRLRALLILLAMALGVAAVVTLTALGDGARRFVVNQFASLGSNLIIVLPGRAETSGGFPGAIVGETPRDLTLDDAESLVTLGGIRRYAPLNVGVSEISTGGRLREVTILGSTANLIAIRGMKLSQGNFTAGNGPNPAEIVLGGKLARELFPAGNVVGQRVRLGDRRFRITGVFASQGESMGFNTDEITLIPIDHAQALLNTESLFRILVEASSRAAIEPAKAAIREAIKLRHDGEEDVTVITQDAVLTTFDRIFKALTFAVSGIAAISLAVAGILVMNVMLVAVSQRTAEIGLLKALGATRRNIKQLFLLETLWLSLAGAAAGIALGYAGSFVLRLAYPQLPAYPPAWASLAAIATALLTGILASLLPASRAAKLNPVLALSRR